MNIRQFNRYIIYLISLFIISLGASISIKANLGTSPLICLPYVSSEIVNLSVGTVCLIFNFIFVFIQIILLRKDFEKRQLLQIIIGIVFSFFIDFSLRLIGFIHPVDYISQLLVLFLSCIICAFGVLLEIKTKVVYLPPDGMIVAISKILKKEFGKVKPFIDTTLVIISISLSFIFLGYLTGVREGTVISALIIGPLVRILKKYLEKYIDALI